VAAGSYPRQRSTGSRGYRGNEGSVRDISHIQKVLCFPEIVRECLHEAHSPTCTAASRAPLAKEDPGQGHNQTYDRELPSDHRQGDVKPL